MEDDERVRREEADAHRGEVVEGSGVPVDPKLLFTTSRGRQYELDPWPDDPIGPDHEYLSAACYHRMHDNCHGTCKYCPEKCVCWCHDE